MPTDYWQNAPLELHVFDPARDRVLESIRIDSPAALYRARQLLDEHRWQRLDAYALRPDETAPKHSCGLEGGRHSDIAEGQGIAVQYHQPAFIVKIPRQRVLVRQDFPQWQQRPQWKLCQYDRLPTILSGVWASRELGVFLVRIESLRCNERCGHTHYHAVRFAVGSR